MSWKGFTKGVVRAPQTVKQRFNLGDTTKDAVYIDAERRFQDLESETKKLHSESKKYFEAIKGLHYHHPGCQLARLTTDPPYLSGMLNSQIDFSKAVADIYRPISGRLSDPGAAGEEGNPEGIRACEEYENVVRDLLETLQPELEMIQTRVIQPADELLEIIKVIRKTAQKRQHKQLDYDRHRTTYQKLKDKKEKSLKDEKAMYKAEADVEQATQEFNYFNDLLKDELPKLFALEREFIKPLFQSFYYMQLNVFYTLHERMQALNIGYFDFSTGIEEAFQLRRGDVQEQIEAIPIVRFKTTGGGSRRPTSKYGGQGSRLAIEGRPSSSSSGGGGGRLAIEAPPKPPSSSTSSDISSTRRTTHDSFISLPPPPYSAPLQAPATDGNSAINRANSTGGSWGALAKAKGAAPPPPKPKPARLSGASPLIPQVPTATALYDYEAQAEGDLSFVTGDVIEIVQRGAPETWWTGKINGREGQFPGNYVRVNQ
ncbi:MAG: hypothetical protein M1816_001798 [Peltula sp. TS41687]|nr:MAG: hypothetical protein M1816_001798 [Peltula sp. TS41687]